jgi:predicted RNase H-like nuclease (RuvC/YqgF family)
METRVARLEVHVEHIQHDIAEIKTDIRSLREAVERLHRRLDSDFRMSWAGLIATNLGLGGLMAKGFGWL